MDPDKKNPQIEAKSQIDVTRSASVRYFSVYPRKYNKTSTELAQVAPADGVAQSSNQRHARTADQPNTPKERYTSRPQEFGPNLNRGGDASGGNINYAWVD